MYTIAQNWKKKTMCTGWFCQHKAKQSTTIKMFVFSFKKQFMFNINEIQIIGLVNTPEKKNINHCEFQDQK